VSPRSKAQERSQRKEGNLADFLLPLYKIQAIPMFAIQRIKPKVRES